VLDFVCRSINRKTKYFKTLNFTVVIAVVLQRHSIFIQSFKGFWRIVLACDLIGPDFSDRMVVMLSDPFRGKRAWRNSTETQRSGHAPRSEPEAKNERSSAKVLCQRLAASTWWCDPRPSYEVVDRNGETAFPRGPTSGHPQSSGIHFKSNRVFIQCVRL